MKKMLCAICIVGIAMSLCTRIVFASASDSSPPDITHPDSTDIIDAYFEENMDHIAGAAVIQIENGRLANEYYYGLADIENNIAVDESTIFEWASITKLLIWTSTMQLVERGEIELDRDIRDYLPEGFLARLSYDKPITMLNLMNHNAGWAEVTKDSDTFDPSQVMALDEALKKCEPRQIFEPGTVVAYSNYGAALAGYIVERVSGKPCWQYVNDNIFEPLGMDDTTLHPTQENRPDLAARREMVKGYDYERNYISRHRAYDNIYPAGATMGTASDMAKFAMALMPPDGTGSPLFQKSDTLDLMLTPSLFFSDNSPENAHGFWIEWRGDKIFYGHGGNFYGFSCNLLFAPETREALIITNNSPGGMVSLELADALLGRIELPYEAVQGAGTAKEVAGFYTYARKSVDTFSAIGNNHVEPYIVKAKDDTTITIGTTVKGIQLVVYGELVQVAPYIFQDEKGDVLRFVYEDGKVSKIMMMCCDVTKKPTWQVVFDYSLLWLVYLAAGYCATMLIASAIRKLAKKPAKNRLRVLRNIGGGFYLAILANVFVCVDKMDNWAEYNTLIPHFIINALTLPAFVLYTVFLIKINKKDCTKGDIRLSVITGLCLLILLIGAVAFNLWR